MLLSLRARLSYEPSRAVARDARAEMGVFLREEESAESFNKTSLPTLTQQLQQPFQTLDSPLDA